MLTYQDLIKNGEYDTQKNDIIKSKSSKLSHTHSLSTNNKSSKYMKEFIIPELNAKAVYYEKLYNNILKRKEKELGYRRKVRKQSNARIHIKKREMFKKLQQQVNKRSEILYYEKTKVTMLEKSNYIDGILAYPFIFEYLKSAPVYTSYELQVLVIAYCHNYIMPQDYESWGFSKRKVAIQMNRLVKKGTLQKITVNRKKVFSVNPKASNFIRDFIRQYRKYIVSMFKALDGKMNPENIPTWARYKGQSYKRLKSNIYEETDLNKFTD